LLITTVLPRNQQQKTAKGELISSYSTELIFYGIRSPKGVRLRRILSRNWLPQAAWMGMRIASLDTQDQLNPPSASSYMPNVFKEINRWSADEVSFEMAGSSDSGSRLHSRAPGYAVRNVTDLTHHAAENILLTPLTISVTYNAIPFPDSDERSTIQVLWLPAGK
jgi:hypothetical protein